MILEDKDITFHINNKAYTVSIGSDIDNEVELGIKKFLDISKDIEVEELLLAYLRKTQELIYFKKDVENQTQNLIQFKQTKIN